jgi:hypothetical protein
MKLVGAFVRQFLLLVESYGRTPTSRILASKDLPEMRAVIGGNDVRIGGFDPKPPEVSRRMSDRFAPSSRTFWFEFAFPESRPSIGLSLPRSTAPGSVISARYPGHAFPLDYFGVSIALTLSS